MAKEAQIKAKKKKAKDNDDLYRDMCNDGECRRIVLTLPIAPSVNHMYINTRRGGKVYTKAALEYIDRAIHDIHEAVDKFKWKKQSDSVWYYLDIVVYMPDRKLRDNHNMLKILLDVLEEEIIENDYYVMPRVQSVELDRDNPRMEMCITDQKQKDRTKAKRMTK